MLDRFSGSKPTLPIMESSSRADGLSMNGMDGDTFIVTAEERAWATARVRETDAPAMALEKPVTMGATKAILG